VKGLFHCGADTRQTILIEARCNRDVAAAVNSHTSRRMSHDCSITGAEIVRDSSHGECSGVHIKCFILSIGTGYNFACWSRESLVNEIVQDDVRGETVGIEERRSSLGEGGSLRDYSAVRANDITGYRLRVTEMHRGICGNRWKSESAGESERREQTKGHGNTSFSGFLSLWVAESVPRQSMLDGRQGCQTAMRNAIREFLYAEQFRV
jgi:hypothetical protein